MIEVGQSQVELLKGILAFQGRFIAEPDARQAYEQALKLCVHATHSEFGVVGELRQRPDGTRYLSVRAAWGNTQQKAFRELADRSAESNIELNHWDEVFNTIARNRTFASSSSNGKPPKKGDGTLPGFPPFTSLLALPLAGSANEPIGMLLLVNRRNGYDNATAAGLQPVCDALAGMLAAQQRDRKRREAEDALRESEARLRIFADHVTDGIFLQDSQARVVDVNRRACESLGYSREELIGMTPVHFDTEITAADIEERLAQLANGQSIHFDSRHRRKDGSEYPVEIRIRPLSIDGKMHTLALVCNISERKQFEERLRESQERLRLALAATRMGVWEWDILTTNVYWSPECYEVYGIPEDKLRGEDFTNFVHPQDREALTQWVEQAMREGTYTSLEFRLLLPGGETRWMSTCATVRRNEKGQAVKMIGSARNITKEKLAANEMREQNAILRTILESTTDFIYMKDVEGKYVTINASAAAFIGKPVREIIGHTDDELFPPDIAGDIKARESELFAKESELRFEEAIPGADRMTYLSTAKNVCRDSSGKVIGLVGITRDITAHIEAEEALRQSTTILENIVENIPLAVFIKDPNDAFRIRLWNKAAESIFGFPREEIIGSNADDFWPPEQAHWYHEVDRHVMRNGDPVDIAEEPSTSRDGKPMFVHTRKMPLFDRHGNPTLLLAICEDITDRKRSEEALREARQRLEFTLQGADVGLWDWDLATNGVNFSDEWKSQLGYSSKEVGNTNAEWESRVHPDDLAQARERVNDAIARRTSEYRSEFRMRHKDGSWRWILSRGAVIDDLHGKPARMLGVHIDITDRKRAEEALQASESRYRTFVDHATDAFFLQDRQGRVLDVNEQACASLGYQRHEIIGKFPYEFDPDVTAESVKNTLAKLEFGQVIAFDSHHTRKDGTTFPVEIRLKPFWINDQRYHVGLVRDITERKRTEEALRESEARLRTLLENLDKVAVQAYEPDGTITFWNHASELFYGYTAEEALGRDLIQLLHAEHTREQERQVMAEALRTGKPPGAEEVEVVRRDGSKITVFASRIVHPRASKQPEFFCFDVDISDRKRAEEELALRQAELLHASRLSTVGQMVAEISHEVAQPLNAIGNFAAASKRILETNIDEQRQSLDDYVQAILDQNQRCITILGRLRDFSRRAPAMHTSCDIDQLLHDSVDLVSLELRRNNIKVKFQLDDDLPAVLGDRVQLQQVVVNLLTNARDALEGQPDDRRTIIVRGIAEPDGVVFEVEDSGCGLSGDATLRLFDPFFTTKRHGMGIGLSICQSIIKNHAGRIDAISNPKGGATFRVRLPLIGKNGP